VQKYFQPLTYYINWNKHSNSSFGPSVVLPVIELRADRHRYPPHMTEGLEHQLCHEISKGQPNMEYMYTPRHQDLQVHPHLHTSSPSAPILSQMNPFDTLPISLPKTIFIPTSTYASVFRVVSFLRTSIRFPLLSHACRMPRPPNSPSLFLPNDISG
jgi:hypothetical protein